MSTRQGSNSGVRGICRSRYAGSVELELDSSQEVEEDVEVDLELELEERCRQKQEEVEAQVNIRVNVKYRYQLASSLSDRIPNACKMLPSLSLLLLLFVLVGHMDCIDDIE